MSSYTYRKANHLCYACGDKLPDGYTKTYCPRCAEEKNAQMRETKRIRRELGLCQQCGKEKPSSGKTCDVCKKKNLDNKQYFIKIGKCFMCRKNPIYGNEKTCPECRAKEMERATHRLEDPNKKEKIRECNKRSKKKLREKRKEKGLCTICGRRNADKGYVTCEICRIRTRKRHNDIPREMRKQYGICYICGAELNRGQSLCAKCCDTVSKNLPKDGGNEHWRRDNDYVFRKLKYKY